MRLEGQMKKLRQLRRKVKHTVTQRKEKTTQKTAAGKSDNTTRRNKIKRYWQKKESSKDSKIHGQTIQAKQDIPKWRKKILPTIGEVWTMTNQQPEAKETNNFGIEYNVSDYFRMKKMIPQGIKRKRWLTIYRPAHPLRSQNEPEKRSHCMNWLQESLLYGW